VPKTPSEDDGLQGSFGAQQGCLLQRHSSAAQLKAVKPSSHLDSHPLSGQNN